MVGIEMKIGIKGEIIKENRLISKGIIVVEGEKIAWIGEEADYVATGEEEILDYRGHWVCPGLIDLHIHGQAGFDVMDATEEALIAISKSLVQYGVTGFLATTMTAPWSEIMAAIKNVVLFSSGENRYARVLGIHLEGPWINVKYKGAQKQEDILEPTLQQVESILKVASNQLKLITVAPEIPGALPVIEKLCREDVICSIGHSNATWEEVDRAEQYGASHFTHLYNAMRGIHHREPGVVGAALTKPQMTVDLIVDLVHVHPKAVELVYTIKGREKLLLISDGMRAVGKKDGVYELGGQSVYVKEGIACLVDGTLAGSTLTLNRAVLNMCQTLKIPVIDAVYMAATAPAKKLGISTYTGSLEVGKDADVAIFSPSFEPLLTMVKGEIVYQNGGYREK
jgi:N-acetylglucosamine-6-phosphate deacetylase